MLSKTWEPLTLGFSSFFPWDFEGRWSLIMDPGQENWSIWVPRAHQTSQAGRKTGAMGRSAMGVSENGPQIYIYTPRPFFEGNWCLANWMIATHLNLGGCPFSDTCEFPRTQHWPDRIHVGILLGSFSKIVTIVLENLLYFFVGKCITEGMGNRGVIHKAGSFWIWLPKLRSKPHWNWNGMQILANVGLSRMNLPFGDSLYHPFVVIWELVYAWVCHSTQIGIFFSSWNPFSTRGSRTCWDHFLIELWWSAKLSGLTTREYMALYPPKKYPVYFMLTPPNSVSMIWQFG